MASKQPVDNRNNAKKHDNGQQLSEKTHEKFNEVIERIRYLAAEALFAPFRDGIHGRAIAWRFVFCNVYHPLLT